MSGWVDDSAIGGVEFDLSLTLIKDEIISNSETNVDNDSKCSFKRCFLSMTHILLLRYFENLVYF